MDGTSRLGEGTGVAGSCTRRADARKTGRCLGVDEQEYQRDFASFVRYYTDLEQHARAHVVPPIRPLWIGEHTSIVPLQNDESSPLSRIAHKSFVRSTWSALW